MTSPPKLTTPEEIATLEQLRHDYTRLVLTSDELTPDAARAAREYRSWVDGALPALLETAKQFHRLVGAIDFRLAQTPEEFVDEAREMGWKGDPNA